ncbi:bifunctional indole-3-glycerol-phosphate synthase TrpC/phosphoribosylanthranilate isomerase TrpF [Candidatus Ishikawella capsulata]|uniref:Multifunctional fusion protein n=1 Tax=Candidatus Ishikawaella capsulata Mpkobe TaxID=476281 RepID=C5WCA4_9ENTR|nr:bifunctional indole-3-glycerol-phosphate synthase TrpC/phosphoribosylanthranilate isomerase TrpF [Candidatus Ishikawaella capsulata]BAH82960.1 bifunctional indole-3-glycerol phosphate synthase/phosphoribosylanthranilate isomerase [Candidatus Ishikawaella capsulata Mpkobe]
MQDHDILHKIIKHKIQWIKDSKAKTPFEKLSKIVQPAKRYFYKALDNINTSLILECKKASPSHGIIRKEFNIHEIAKTYSKYASVISVITEDKYFHGNFDFLSTVSGLVSQPILCKDFIIDPYQILLARYHKADAILLMLSILDNQQYARLANLAHELNIGILTEINNEAELKRAIELNAKVIGINNRNLHDLSVDLDRTRKLSLKIPQHIKIISESGINKYEDIIKLSNLVNGFLIGSALMLEPNMNLAVNKLLFGDNKICGLTSAEDAKMVYQKGAVYGGLIFVDRSLRLVNKNNALQIVNSVPLKYVGVFRNAEIFEIIKLTMKLNLSVIQLHGNEDDTYVTILRKSLPTNTKIWKAISIKDAVPDLNGTNIDRYIFDNGEGGTGHSFNWSLLKDKKLHNVMIAGNLNINNCVQAVNLGAAGLDFNSGVEIRPGVKDITKVTAVFNRLKEYKLINSHRNQQIEGR